MYLQPTEIISPNIVFAFNGLNTKSVGCKLSAQRINRGLATLDLFKYANGLWSVSKTKSWPYRYFWNLWIAHTMAKHSFSIVAYAHSQSFSFLLAYAIGSFLSCSNWKRTAPKPRSDASVWRTNVSWRLGNFKIGKRVRVNFRVWNAYSWQFSQTSFVGQPFFVRSVRGNAMWAKFGTNFR